MPITSIYDWLYSIISTDFFDSFSKLILINFSLNADVNSSILLTHRYLTAMFILTLFEYVILCLFLDLPDSHPIPHLLPNSLLFIYCGSLIWLLRSHLLSICSGSTCSRSPSLYSRTFGFLLGTLCWGRWIDIVLNQWLFTLFIWRRFLDLREGVWVWSQRYLLILFKFFVHFD